MSSADRPDPPGAPPSTVTEPGDAWAPAAAGAGLEGRDLGRYQVRTRLGAGGMGEVYEAFDTRLDRVVALKIVAPHRRGAIDQARLLREARLLARLAHPNIVAVYDVDLDGDRLFLAMERVRGASLREWMRARARTPREIVAAVIDVATGLAAAHAVGVVHRDVKPENVLVGDDGRARVVDFGIARAAGDDVAGGAAAAPVAEDGALTRTGGLVGTPVYMAPEQRRGGAAGAHADQFALFATAYELFTGRRLMQGAPDAAAYRDAPGRVLRERAIPRRLRRVIARGVAEAPADRYPDLAAAIAALRRATAPRWPYAAAAAGALAAGGIAIALSGGDAATVADPCGGGEARRGAIWSPAWHAALEPAFAASGAADWRANLAYVAERLDRRAATWAAAHRDACEATHVRGERSPAALDARMACLDRRLAETEALLARLADAPTADVVARAPTAVDQLPGVDACDDPDRLGRIAALPADPEARARIRLAELALARVRTLYDLADDAAATRLVDEAAAALGDVAYAPVAGELALWRARLTKRAGDLAAAQRHATEAARLAVEGGDVALEAEAWITELDIRQREGDGKTAEVTARMAESALHRAGDPPRLTARYWNVLGGAYFRTGRYREAEAAYDRAARLFREVDGERSIGHSDARLNLAAVASHDGRPAVALERGAASVALIEGMLGPDHLDLSYPLSSMAIAATDLGRLDEADRYLARVLAIRRAHHGDASPVLAPTLAHRAAIAGMRGDLDAARAATEEAVALAAAAGGELDVAEMLIALAGLEWLAGDVDGAARTTDRAAAAVAALHDPPPHLVRDVAIARAQLALGRGDHAAAQAACQRLDAELAADDDHPLQAVQVGLCLGEVELARGAHAAARDRLARAAERAVAAGAPYLAALAREREARAADAAGDAAAARAAARAGLDALGTFEGRLAAAARERLRAQLK